MPERNEKIEHEIKRLAAVFFESESNSSSLMTITDCKSSIDGKKAVVYMTVLPVDREATALDFAMRKRTEFRDYVRKNLKIRMIPFIDIKIDDGEKNRQRIDDLLAQK